MDHVILHQPGGERILSLRDYIALATRLPQADWPPVHCIACGRPVSPPFPSRRPPGQFGGGLPSECSH